MIFLCGMMGAGKTSIGKELARTMNKNFIDTDELIEQQEKMSINQIFHTKSEDYFRDLEMELLRNFNFGNSIVSLGGGAICSMERITIIQGKGHLIYLELPVSVLAERLLKSKQRPLVMEVSFDKVELENRLTEILRQRERYYKKADIRINGNQSINEIVTELSGYFNV
jgi:shikimate kinase